MPAETRWFVFRPETIADRCGLPVETVASFLALDGCPEKNADGTWRLSDLQRFFRSIGDTGAPRTRAVPKSAADVQTLQDAKLLLALKQAEKVQLAIDKESGTLVPKREVERHLSGLAAQVRAVLVRSPARYAPQLAGLLEIEQHRMRVELEKLFEMVGDDMKSALKGAK